MGVKLLNLRIDERPELRSPLDGPEFRPWLFKRVQRCFELASIHELDLRLNTIPSFKCLGRKNQSATKKSNTERLGGGCHVCACTEIQISTSAERKIEGLDHRIPRAQRSDCGRHIATIGSTCINGRLDGRANSTNCALKVNCVRR